MKKEAYRDYATEAFRIWAAWGCPSYDEAVERIRASAIKRAGESDPANILAYADAEVERKSALLCDILACEKCFELLREDKKYICDAIKDIYMHEPWRTARRNEIARRVLRFSIDNAVSERQVYRWLKNARDLFAGLRGLRIDNENV